VLDASAVLALMHAEPGDAEVAATLPGALISAVNLAEVASKLTERGMPVDEAHSDILALGLRVVAFDTELARMVAELRPLTRSAGLSLGDRCCLALARREGAVALTAERDWGRIAGAAGVTVRGIRPAS
jgi:PIN domain nuclease of toxin-antitoxin system